MDVSHIITQVSRRNDTVTGAPTVKESVIQSTVKRRRNILSALFCCFGDHAASAASAAALSRSLPINEARNAEECGKLSYQTEVVSSDADSARVKGNGNWQSEPNHNYLQAPTRYLLPKMQLKDTGKKCLVIDLDETLVHSSFKPVENPDFIVPVEIEGTRHQVYVLKRPHVDTFLQKMGELYECVLFTASLAKYADPVADLLDHWGVFRTRLFRESCVFHRGNYVKDLGRLGRNLSQVIIIDNSPASYIFHPDNAVPISSWFDDAEDTELLDLCAFFESLSKADSVYTVLQSSGEFNGRITPGSMGT